MLQVGQAAAKMRRMTAEFRSQFMDVMREAEIDETKSDVERLAERAKAATGMDPLAQIRAELIPAVGSAEKPATLPPSASKRTAKAGPWAILSRFGHAPNAPERGRQPNLARPSRS